MHLALRPPACCPPLELSVPHAPIRLPSAPPAATPSSLPASRWIACRGQPPRRAFTRLSVRPLPAVCVAALHAPLRWPVQACAGSSLTGLEHCCGAAACAAGNVNMEQGLTQNSGADPIPLGTVCHEWTLGALSRVTRRRPAETGADPQAPQCCHRVLSHAAALLSTLLSLPPPGD